MEHPLSEEDVEGFVRNGYVMLKGAFSRDAAAAARKFLWARLEEDGIAASSPRTWPVRHGIAECYDSADDTVWSDVLTPRLYNAIAQLCGPGPVGKFACGWWVVTFPSVSEAPWAVEGRWHVDGHTYRHFPDSRETGLIPIFLFNDIGPGDGGTALSTGSHIEVGKILWRQAKDGLDCGALSRRARQVLNDSDTIEVNGEAGDVMLMHPFMVHARSRNLGRFGCDSVRFMCHPQVPLLKPMNVGKLGDSISRNELESSFTPVEEAIVCSRRLIEEEDAIGFASFGSKRMRDNCSEQRCSKREREN